MESPVLAPFKARRAQRANIFFLSLFLFPSLFSVSFEVRAAGPPATPTPSAAASLDAPVLLASIRKAYSSSPSVSCTFVQTYAPAGFAETQPETGRLILQAPDRVRFDYDGPEGKVFTFDGKAGHQYVAADRQLVVRTLKPQERERLPLVFLESTDALLARYTARAASTNTGLFELTLTPRAGADPKSLTLLATAAGDVKRLILVDAAGNRTAFTFTQKLSGPRRPDSDFALAPPAGTKILSE